MWRALVGVAGSALVATPAVAEPFADLRAAYETRNASAAAAAYAPDASLVYEYTGAPVERFRGREEIAKSFATLFTEVDKDTPLDLNFRTIRKDGNRVTGLYRLRFGRTQTSYGTFDVTLSPEGKFQTDRSTSATVTNFEEAAGPVMLKADGETLDGSYYDKLTGRYRLTNGCTVIVTRSTVRLFARNSCTNEWRGLSRVSGREWTAGDKVVSDKVVSRYRFAAMTQGASPSLEILTGKVSTTARRQDSYARKAVAFTSADGTKLAGDIYLPTGPAKRRPAMVIVHGSGPQDRNGYASIISVLADSFAANGRVVLTFDKRGVGGSAGDWSRAGFDKLAADAIAGMRYLATRPEVDRTRIGLGGSSQAGWVVAEAVRAGAKPSDVALLGAAGSALTVPEQNLYNTEVRMRCGGLSPADIKLGLDQQRAFFAFMKDPSKAAELDRLTDEGKKRPALSDWLFPNSKETDRNGGAWFTTLDLNLDPNPIWKAYEGKALFILSEFDDSTPTAVAAPRLKRAGFQPVILSGAQHLGLQTRDVCKAELPEVSAFSPSLFGALDKF